MKISYAELEKLNARFDLSAAESATAISRAGRPFLPFSVQAVDDRRLNRTPPRNAPYGGSDADLQLRPAPGDINQDYQKRCGQKGFLESTEGDADDDVDDQVSRAKNHLEAYQDENDSTPKHERLRKASVLLGKAADRLQPKSGSQHLKMR